MANKGNVRWAFNTREWQPTKEEILLASSYIQNEEKQRISRFVFQNDAKSSLIGRLMLRKYVQTSTSTPYGEIKFGRDDRGKPFLLNPIDLKISFNVSHQGDFVVLAGCKDWNVGIDVMKIEPPVNKNIPEFFRIMARQFSPREWSTIRSFSTELEQIACFYRIWCLKESYVKNVGFGITVPLDEISFQLKTLHLEMGKIVTDTVLYERNALKEDWIFEETLLDEKHAVAVSLQKKDNSTDAPVCYEVLSYQELVEEAKSLCSTDETFSDEFVKKQLKNF